MLIEVKEFIVVPIGKTPSLSDCKQAVDLAIEHHCFVQMKWNVKYSGDYTTFVGSNDEPKEIFESLPKIYPV